MMPNMPMMGNPMMGGNPMMSFMQNFMRFCNQMQGQNPQQLVNQMLQDGRMTQEQFNALSQQAQQFAPMFQQMSGQPNNPPATPNNDGRNESGK